MGKRGKGYGSEDQFLRYRAERPTEFDRLLLGASGAQDGHLRWHYPIGAEREREPQGVDFIDNPEVQRLWGEFWPQRGRAQCWDGVATLESNGTSEWVLIEAKANAVELVTSPCGASKDGGLDQIVKALGRVKRELGVHRDYPWTGTYYQYANRLAALFFLNTIARLPARLLNVYFMGDRFPDGRACPADESEWRPLIEARRITLGLPRRHSLSDRVYDVFVPVTLTPGAH